MQRAFAAAAGHWHMTRLLFCASAAYELTTGQCSERTGSVGLAE
jgi:hypothetical protein